MSLRYKFHHLFFGGKINKKRLYQILVDLDNANTGETTDISEIEQAIGKASGDGAGGILKDIKDINDALGDADTEGTILYRLAQLEAEDTTQAETPAQSGDG